MLLSGMRYKKGGRILGQDACSKSIIQGKRAAVGNNDGAAKKDK